MPTSGTYTYTVNSHTKRPWGNEAQVTLIAEDKTEYNEVFVFEKKPVDKDIVTRVADYITKIESVVVDDVLHVDEDEVVEYLRKKKYLEEDLNDLVKTTGMP